MKIYVIQNLQNHLIVPKLFKTDALAFQYLNKKYPSLYEREDRRGHHLGGDSAYIKNLPNPFRIKTVVLNQEELDELEEIYGKNES